MDEARSEMKKALRSDHLRGCPVILLANKQDVSGALTVTEMKDKFNMREMCVGRDWLVQPCSASTGFGCPAYAGKHICWDRNRKKTNKQKNKTIKL
uniref:ADP-ribosylation factor-like 14 n=1 Tax=Xiphophorus couchianus TaxID=32473 RepID=A0A3B5L491_9TELE